MEHGRRQRRGSHRDRISELPDDLLQGILLHLQSTQAAPRTSALSRRWRRVWVNLPVLVLAEDVIYHRASFLDTVDNALAVYTADPPIRLQALQICVPYQCQNVPGDRVAVWLLFALPRLAGQLHLWVPLDCQFGHKPPQEEIDLPPLKRVTGITLLLSNRFLLRPRPAGVFAALADLNISGATLDARALEVLVSSQCPRLEKLTLMVVTLVNDSDVCISSASLRRLTYSVWRTCHLNVAAPNLQELRASNVADIHVAAPNLTVLNPGSIWKFVFADAVPHLRLLDVAHWSGVAPLIPWFDTVGELRLRAPVENDGFQRFMDATIQLPKCETLLVDLTSSPHAAVASVLHILRRSKSTRKLVILLGIPLIFECSLACQCRSPYSTMAHDISLDALEEVEFRLSRRGDEYMEILKLLLSVCSISKLKNVEINVTYGYGYDAASLSDCVYQRVRDTCPPNIGVRLNVSPNGRCQKRKYTCMS